MKKPFNLRLLKFLQTKIIINEIKEEKDYSIHYNKEFNTKKNN